MLTNLVIAMMISFAHPAYYPPCGDMQPPLQPSSTCRPSFFTGTVLGVRANVPFAWLRRAPVSDAEIVATILPDKNPGLRIGPGGVDAGYWDGYQWWWYVESLTQPVAGWVEQAALAAIGPTDVTPYTLADWSPGTRVQVEVGLPFLWLRDQPGSAGAIRRTVPARGQMRLAGEAEYDGIQWWWPVEYQGIIGYVEQSLLEVVGAS